MRIFLFEMNHGLSVRAVRARHAFGESLGVRAEGVIFIIRIEVSNLFSKGMKVPRSRLISVNLVNHWQSEVSKFFFIDAITVNLK